MHIVEAHGARIPAIGLGTATLKGETCLRSVSAALEAGYRHIDTAAGYANEEEVGEALRNSSVPRDEVFVTTKVWPSDIAEGDLQRSVEASLARLGLDAADLVLIHWPNRNVPVPEAVGALNDVHRRGLARHIGVSNFNTRLLEEAWAATEAPLAALQCEYHPFLDQGKLLAAVRARGMAFTAYSPAAKTQVLRDPTIAEIAKTHGRTPVQVTLRWLVQQPQVVTIPRSTSPERQRENLEISDFSLSETEMARIAALARPDARLVHVTGFGQEWDD